MINYERKITYKNIPKDVLMNYMHKHFVYIPEQFVDCDYTFSTCRYRIYPDGSDWTSDPTDPTHEELTRYLLDFTAVNGTAALDEHVRPQHHICPFCSVEFHIVGHMETFQEDVAFVFDALGLKVNYFFKIIYSGIRT